jgi:branched-subunit amino acid transport protein
MIDFQTIIIGILFLGAVFYISRSVFLSLKAKKGCGSSCKCGVDFSQIETKK